MSEDALFTVLDETTVQATEVARGPWDPRALHGGPVAALAARGLERVIAEAGGPGDPAFRPARLTVELERPVGLDPLTVAAEVTRPGRSVRSAELTLHDQAGRRLVRATLVAIRVRPEPLDLSGAALPADPPPPPPSGASATPWVIYEGTAFHLHGVRHSFVEGSFLDLGPALDWIRLVVPVVAGEEPSPLQRVAAAADFGNGVSAALPTDGHTFINPDITVTLVREAVGQDIGVAATTRVDAAGVGATETVLWDERGRLGAAVQTLLVERR
jgi:acyl-coenzyme A thioesterase PaaI-like protein